MKRIYLEYNELMNNFALSEGKAYEERRNLKNISEAELMERLRELDSKRVTELYIKKIPQPIKETIANIFESTKIIVKYLDGKIKK